MSKHETPMTRWYRQQTGGTLIEEFVAVRRSATCGLRLLDVALSKTASIVLRVNPRFHL
jgi:hypothetical protein